MCKSEQNARIPNLGSPWPCIISFILELNLHYHILNEVIILVLFERKLIPNATRGKNPVDALVCGTYADW